MICNGWTRRPGPPSASQLVECLSVASGSCWHCAHRRPPISRPQLRNSTRPGDEAGAEAEFEASLACHPEPADYPFERARTLMLRAQIHRKFRRKGSARSTLVAARDEFARIGATGWVNRLNEELYPCQGEPRETAGLTPTEQKVADLIVTGRRTKEVAAALYLSPKTVELHLTRVYRKYGVRSRVELGARMVARYT